MAASKKKSTAKKTTVKKAASKNVSAKKTTASKTAVKKVAPVAAKKKGSSVKQKTAPKKVEAAKNTVSANAKESNSTWMIVSIILGAFLILLLIAIIGMYFNNSKTVVPDVNDSLVDNTGDVVVPVVTGEGVKLLIVEDPTCESCQVDLFASQVKENLISDLEFDKVDYESKEGQAIVQALDAKQVPVYLFSSNMKDRDDWTELEGAFVPVEVKGISYFMLNPQFIPNKVLIEAPVVTDSAIVIGDANAPVTVIEFTDFECPFCAIAEGNAGLVEQFRGQNPTYVPPMPKVLETYVANGDVKVVFYNYPIAQLHPQSRGAHNAGLCANAQGEFEEYSRTLWDNREEWTTATDRDVVYKEYAEELGLDTTAFATCLEAKTYDAQIGEELALGQTYGVSGTPAFFIGRTFISGAQDFEVFKAAIDAELAK